MMNAKELLSLISAVMNRKTRKAAMARLDAEKENMLECDYKLVSDAINHGKVADMYQNLDNLYMEVRIWAKVESN